MPAEVLTQYASAGPLATHTVSFNVPERTNGRSVFVVAFAPTAGGTLGNGVVRHDPWEIAHSVEFTNQEMRVFRCPGALNDGTVTDFVVNFDTPQSLNCIIWEDDVDEVVFYALVRGYTPEEANPFTVFTRGHDIPVMPESFTIMTLWGADTGTMDANLVSYDGGYEPWADSGKTLAPYSGDFPSRTFMARKSPGNLFSNTGVTATADTSMALGNVVDTMSGILSYEVLTENPPINLDVPTVSGLAITGEVAVALRGRWRNGPLFYSYQWQRSADVGVTWVDITDATSSAYILDIADENTLVRCLVSSSNSYGTASVPTSTTLAPVAAEVQGDLFVLVDGTWVATTSKVMVDGEWVGAV